MNKKSITNHSKKILSTKKTLSKKTLLNKSTTKLSSTSSFDIFLSKHVCAWESSSPKKRKEAFSFSDRYKVFLNKAKTERLAVKEIISELKKSTFKDLSSLSSLKKGDKFFLNFKNKVVLAGVVGKHPKELNIVGSHLDSPRLDLKPKPIIQDSNLALCKTHYYGGIKKYHWVNQPLALYGILYTKSGKEISIAIGDKPSDPVFVISDLLPHLSKSQYEKPASKIIEGEQLMVILGGIPVVDADVKDKIKTAILKKLYEDYGLIEEDFFTAELSFVPRQDAMDVGFDSSMIGAYGQDDRVCVFTSLEAIKEISQPKKTALSLFVDKEETGSDGDTGAQSYILRYFSQLYFDKLSLSYSIDAFLATAQAISADATAAMNPNHKDVFDSTNSSFLGFGVSVEKYGGGGGKYGTNDASAEFMNIIRQLLINNSISWQTGELGKIDIGGGGTIAKYLSRYGMSCVDAGPSLLGMHSPFEVASKIDIYNAYLLYKAFLLS
jgi:aspartyl aminopeptidase